MQPGPGWQNPIVAPPGQMQYGVDPLQLRPSRVDLRQQNLSLQQALRQSGQPRFSPIEVTTEGVIWDGHHAARLAAEEGRRIDVRVIRWKVPPTGVSILDLPVET